jgi:hypothetical protein
VQAEKVVAVDTTEEQAGPSRESDDLLTVPLEKLTTVEQVKAAMDAPGVSKTRKQKLKQKLNALQARAAHCYHDTTCVTTAKCVTAAKCVTTAKGVTTAKCVTTAECPKSPKRGSRSLTLCTHVLPIVRMTP